MKDSYGNQCPWRRLVWAGLLWGALGLAVPVAQAGGLITTDTTAANQQVPARPLPIDRNQPLPPRRANAERLRELAAQREFQYQEAKVESGFWARFWSWLWELFSKVSSTKQGVYTWQYGFYTALVIILVYAVLKLLQVDIGRAFGRKPRRSTLPYDVAGENIHEVDFPARIAEAEAAGDFRLATRLGYLAVLKILSDQGLIDWQPDKTNQAYLHELSNGALRNSFREATRQFEYVWYGELPLTATLYQQVRTDQQVVISSLSRRASTLAPTA